MNQHEFNLNASLAAWATLFLEPAIRDVVARVYACQPVPLSVRFAGAPLSAFRVERPWKKQLTLAPPHLIFPTREDLIRYIEALGCRIVASDDTRPITLWARRLPATRDA